PRAVGLAPRSPLRPLVAVANAPLDRLHTGLDHVQQAIAAVHDEVEATYFPRRPRTWPSTCAAWPGRSEPWATGERTATTWRWTGPARSAPAGTACWSRCWPWGPTSWTAG